MSKKDNADRDLAVEELRKILTPNSQVFANVKHVSRSGMYRAISFYTPVVDPETGRVWMRRLDRYIARATGYTFDTRREAVGVSGCGMDMGFAVLYSVCGALWSRDVEGWDNVAQKKEWL